MEWWRRRRRHWPAAGGDRRRRRDIGDDGGDSDVGDEMKTVAASCGDGAVAAAAIVDWRGKEGGCGEGGGEGGDEGGGDGGAMIVAALTTVACARFEHSVCHGTGEHATVRGVVGCGQRVLIMCVGVL